MKRVSFLAGTPGRGLRRVALICVAAVALAHTAAGAPPATKPPSAASRLVVVLGAEATDPEARVAEVLRRRMLNRSDVSVDIVPETDKRAVERADLAIYLALGWDHAALRTLAGRAAPAAATPRRPEGFVVKTLRTPTGRAVLAVGNDKRGTLYAAGEVLRRLTYHAEAVEMESCDVRTAPAYRWRGFSANQGGTMRQVTGARAWTTEERREDMMDYALAGANTFYAHGDDFRFVRQFDLMTVEGCRPNQLPGRHPQWRREGTSPGPYVCPSIPEARAALLKHWDEVFAHADAAAVLRFYAGDPGGCRCDRCAPWGKTFVRLSEEMTALWKKHHPDSEIQLCNQDLTNAGDLAIFAYLNAKPRPWLTSLSYGPGSNAMSAYFRDELREDLFTYPGEGPINRYLAYTLHNLPKQQSIVHYSDITHWISAQYAVARPELHLAMVYGRRTFHQRPNAFYRIFHQIMPFSEGDIIYSEGHHDELHQYLWNRMLWDPGRSLHAIMNEYATLHFGRDAAPEMIQASYQLEKNIEAPVATNDGIDRYYSLVKSAGWKIPPHRMKNDYRWREHMQKAALDKYLQLKLRRAAARKRRVHALLRHVPDAGDLRPALAQATSLLAEPLETPAMKSLRDEAGRLGQESNRIFGVRNTGFFRLDLDLTGLGWLARRVAEAAGGASDADRSAAVARIVGYEDPGPGGFYDNAGVDGRQPHLVVGERIANPGWLRGRLDPNNRPSANTFVYNRCERGRRECPVVFRYDDLNINAAYTVRVTLVAPRIPPEDAAAVGLDPDAIRRTESILADDAVLRHELEVPTYTARRFEFPIPTSVTRDGRLELRFVCDAPHETFAASVVSEVWLLQQPRDPSRR